MTSFIDRKKEGLYRRLLYLCEKKPFRWISDRKYIELFFRVKQGYKLDLDHPETFNEKLQWLKLYDRNPLYTELTDKYLVRDYVAKTIGEQYLVPLLGVWDKAEDIDFDQLPDQFVLKCNHDSGSAIICNDKDNFDREGAIQWLNNSLGRNYFWKGREYNYKNIERKIIAEEIVANERGSHQMYRFLCFDGEPRFVCFAINPGPVFNYYDMDWNVLDVNYGFWDCDSKRDVKRPRNFDRMVDLARKLSKDIPHVRVDLYDTGENVFFSELTFHHFGGARRCSPFKYDILFGAFLKLPK